MNPEWPKNWIEIANRCPRCDRCGTILMPRLYCLSEQHPNVLVCHICSDAYFSHIEEFVEDIKKRKKERQLNDTLFDR